MSRSSPSASSGFGLDDSSELEAVPKRGDVLLIRMASVLMIPASLRRPSPVRLDAIRAAASVLMIPASLRRTDAQQWFTHDAQLRS